MDHPVNPALLRELLDYDPVLGTLTWKHRSATITPDDEARTAFNATRADKPAFVQRPKGATGKIFGHYYERRDVIYCIETGHWPVD